MNFFQILNKTLGLVFCAALVSLLCTPAVYSLEQDGDHNNDRRRAVQWYKEAAQQGLLADMQRAAQAYFAYAQDDEADTPSDEADTQNDDADTQQL